MINSFVGSIAQHRLHNDDTNPFLLSLTARGTAIITELHRLAELVPAPFARLSKPNGKPSTTDQLFYLDKAKKYTLDYIVCDFSYFRKSDQFERSIETDESLKRADETFCDAHVEILTRFYLTFESIQRYANELNGFIVDLENDKFVGLSLDVLLSSRENKQLFCEAYFLLGSMLLTVDHYFEGGLRERLIVAYYRYSSYKSSPESCVDDTCNLLRSTNFKSFGQKLYRNDKTPPTHYRPDEYPESFLARANVNQSVINLLIAELQSLDLYDRTSLAFPNPDHRSSALAKQASMLYILLYFCPNILKSQRSRMREIADKFFSDNWIISTYMGSLVNLIEAWHPYRAARESLFQLLDIDSVSNLTNQYNVRFSRSLKHLRDYLKEGCLDDDFVLDNCHKILIQLREANIVLKWMLLHSRMIQACQTELSRVIHLKVVECQPKQDKLCEFLQSISMVEINFSSIYERLASQCEAQLLVLKFKVRETLNELVSIFNDTKPNRWIKAGTNQALADILVSASCNLESIDFSQTSSRDLLINQINSIESAKETYSDDKCLQVVQLFSETREYLLKMLRYLSLPEGLLTGLRIIGDLSYAWDVIDECFTSHLQQIIKDNPKKISSLEVIFLKLAMSYDNCLVRIRQANLESDLKSVSHYYSTRLVSYIRHVLHIMPTTILELVSSIAALQTDDIFSDMPSKISLDSLKDYASPEKRNEKLRLTSRVSQYAESMIKMQNTCIGDIKINSKQMLEAGIRRELVRKISDSVHNTLELSLNSGGSNLSRSDELHQVSKSLLSRLARLTSLMESYKRSFEYIQDYLFIHGLRIWQEELSRIVKFNVDLAILALNDESVNSQQQDNISIDQQSVYQSAEAPIPVYGDNALRSSFIARILGDILRITNPRETIYDEQVGAWFDQKVQHEQVLDVKIFELIIQSLGAAGLNGLDQMCCSLLMFELKDLDSYLKATTTNSKSSQTEPLVSALKSLEALRQDNLSRPQTDWRPSNKQADARTFTVALSKLAPYSEQLINHLLRIGQLQAIRMSIGYVLSSKCRCDARNLSGCLEALNASLLSLLKCEEQPSQQKPGACINGAGAHEPANCFGSGTSLNQGHFGAFNGSDGTFDERQLGNYRDELMGDEEDLANSQLMFELTSHLEWIGLSDPLSKIYTQGLDERAQQPSAVTLDKRLASIELVFLALLEQCSKFHYSQSISGLAPRQSRGFMESSSNVDAQPLFYGIITFLNHYQPTLSTSQSSEQRPVGQVQDFEESPLVLLLQFLSLYVKCCLDTSGGSSLSLNSIRQSDITLEVANAMLSTVELLRLSRRPSDELLSETFLPNYIADTIQCTVCHLAS